MLPPRLMLPDGLASAGGLSHRSISVYTTEPSARCVAQTSAMRSHSLPPLQSALSMLIRRLATICTGFEVYSGSFCLVLKAVVHHAPVAMCPDSLAVVCRCISVSLVKVIFQFEASVSPTECGFQ